MKKINLIIFLSLFGIIIINSCSKENNIKSFDDNSELIDLDLVKKVFIEKEGPATFETQSGKVYKRDVLLKGTKRDAFIFKTDLQKKLNSPVQSIQTFRIPLSMKGSASSLEANSFPSSSISSSETEEEITDNVEGENGFYGGIFTFTIIRYGGYSTVTVWPSVLHISDYTVRATVLGVVTIGHKVTFDVNYVYTRNFSVFKTAQVTLVSY